VQEKSNITNKYQAAWIAKQLQRRGSGAEMVSTVLADARIDLQPHQVSAALFALQNPYLKGAMLCDQVGLGKTIQAGIVVAQKWAEGKRNIIVVCPATLRHQWKEELTRLYK